MIFAAVDMGGTKTMVAVERDGTILGKERFATAPSRGLDAVSHDCAVLLKKILDENSLTAGDIDAAGISAPGMVNADGIMIMSPVTGWVNADLAGAIKRELGISAPSRVDNDVNACALAEASTTGKRNMLWITVSTGIGGAIVTDGRVYSGAKGIAGEIGHTKVEYADPRKCACGQDGCVEAYASGTAVGKTARRLADSDEGYRKLYADAGLKIDAEGCSILARGSDEKSMRIFDEAGDYLGRAIANAVNILDCGVVYIGGGMAASLDLMLPAIRRRMKLNAVPSSADIEIMPSEIGYEASLRGAFALAAEAYDKAAL